MNKTSEVGCEWSLRKVGIAVCVCTLAVLFICAAAFANNLDGALFAWFFQIPVPLMAWGLFAWSGRLGQIHAAALMIPYIMLMPVFWIIAPGEASRDAQGALIFVFGPILIQSACCLLLAVFSLVYFIVRRVKKMRRSKEAEGVG